MAIPIVDFGKFLNGSKAERQEAAFEIDAAFRNVGFVFLKNHSVAREKLIDCFKWSKRFFDLEEEVKMLAPHPPGGSHHRGYSGVGLEKVTQNVFSEEDLEALRQIPDVKESFESGNVDDEQQPNIWLPEDKLPGFRPFMESFFTDCRDLIHYILRSLALALDLESENQLSDTHAQSLFQLRLLHYPAVPVKFLADGKKSRISAHSDFGTLTLLFQDAIGGLEIEDPKQPGVFRKVEPIEDAVLVNIGDLMERWSNSRWRSTVHRVVAPPGENEMCPPRYSIPFFATADPDTMIEALPGCWSETNPKRFDSVTAWGYVQMRMAALYE
ncbi:thymine dioxygenase [Microthyrium microscopicum]|uniref:Thymine dioxygenase n=1 Tax=Microthyrium microscopicum TaxID=703497 RepID=A0A6A6TUC9_9PEZI|nr:thymine dioxygenase [Microthyrium microscopicum]